MSFSDEDDHWGVPLDESTSRPLNEDEVPLRMHGYLPTNCGKPTAVISNESSRKAYRRMTVYIDEDPDRNCCTIDDFNVLKLYKATELPVKLSKTDRRTTFFYSGDLNLKY